MHAKLKPAMGNDDGNDDGWQQCGGGGAGTLEDDSTQDAGDMEETQHYRVYISPIA